MPDAKCNVCEKDLILDEENVCAQCELINGTSKNNETETENNVHCGTCKDVVDENTEGLFCDVCDKWYHNGCCENPLTEYLHYLLKEAPNNVKWFCDKCIWEREEWINGLKTGNNDHSVQSDRSDDLSDIEVENIQNNLNKRKRGRPRRLNEDEKGIFKYDESNEPECLIDESSLDYIPRKKVKKAKKVKKVKNSAPRKTKKVRRTRKYACDMCIRRFMTEEDLEAHILKHDGDDKPFKCTECDKAFTLKSGLKQHSFTHFEGKPFYCDLCARGFKWKSAYERHQKDYHSEDTTGLMQCPLCEFTSTNQSRIDAHMRKHSDIRPFKCTQCDHASKTVHCLKAHMLTHTDLKTHECPECGKKFKKPDELKTHMYIHTGAWPCECAVCGAKFASESALVVHSRKHTGERPYPCELCDHRSRSKALLNQHMKTHTGARALNCDVCGKKLCNPNALKVHMMRHTGEKPYKCELCGKKYRIARSLRMHMIYHSKNNFQTFDRPYKCECGNSYKELKSLNKHIRGDRTRRPCQGANGPATDQTDMLLAKTTNNEQKPDLSSFNGQDSIANRFSIKPLPPKAPRKKPNPKPLPLPSEQALAQVLNKPKENFNQHNSQEAAPSMYNPPTLPQNFQNPQNPPSLLYAGITNNYSQYHDMIMNASSSQWAQNKFWN